MKAGGASSTPGLCSCPPARYGHCQVSLVSALPRRGEEKGFDSDVHPLLGSDINPLPGSDAQPSIRLSLHQGWCCRPCWELRFGSGYLRETEARH